VTAPRPVSLRPMRDDDAAAVVRLLPDLGYEASTAQLVRRLEAIRAWPDHEVFVAEDAGAIVGMCHVHGVRQMISDGYAELSSLVVAGACQGRGVGRALLALACEWASARGYPRVRLRSGVQREAAHAFYLAQGFAQSRGSYGFEKWLVAAAAGAA